VTFFLGKKGTSLSQKKKKRSVMARQGGKTGKKKKEETGSLSYIFSGLVGAGESPFILVL